MPHPATDCGEKRGTLNPRTKSRGLPHTVCIFFVSKKNVQQRDSKRIGWRSPRQSKRYRRTPPYCSMPPLLATRVPYRTVYITPSWCRFSVLDISTVGMMPVPTRSALEESRRELSEDVSFGVGTLLVVEQSSLENRPRGVRYSIHRHHH